MQSISLPQSPKFTKTGENSGRFEILGCYPGYGTTLGNALRRVLLSSLSGAAITSVKIKGVSHEFSAVSGILEDVVQIILNLKKIRFSMEGEEPVKVSLNAKGEGKVTAKSIKCPAGVEVVNKDQLIATVTDKKMELVMEMEIGKGLGYVPVEQQDRENKEIGVIAIDAIYTPIRRVNYLVEDMRIGKRTDFNKITLDIETDGSITPEDAFKKSIDILVNQFSALTEVSEIEEEAEKEEVPSVEEKAPEEKEESKDPLKMKLSELKGLSNRTLNVLGENELEKVKDIVKMKEEDIKELKGMGDKGIKEIKKAIGEFGLTLK